MAAPMFDVRRGEHMRVARAGGAHFAMLAGFTISETARDALFLGSNGTATLALAYLALAVVAVIALAANAQLVRRLGRRSALVVTLFVAAAGTAAFTPLPRHASIALVLYLWTGLVGTLVVVQFWLLAATRFTTAEAKRVYGPIAASGAVGTLAGALTAWLLLRFLAVESLLPVAAAFYLFAAGLLARDSENVEPRLGAARSRGGQAPPAKLRGQTYALQLAILTVCATAVALLADFLLKSAAAASFGTQDLARFFARFNATVALLSLVFQLVGTAWLARKLGVLGMVLLLPILMLAGGVVCMLTAGSFFAITMTKGADASLRYSVNRVATELCWMPVPENVRARVREPLESVVTRLVQALAAALLLVLVAFNFANASVLAGGLCAFAALWTVTAAGLRKRYLAQLRLSVGRLSSDPVHELDSKAIEVVVDALSSDDDDRVIAAIRTLVARRRARLIPALVLRHESIDVRAAALEAMATPGRTDWISLTRRMLGSTDPRVRKLSLHALGRIGDETAIMEGLCDVDPRVSAHGVFWSLQSASSPIVRDHPAILRLLALPGEPGAIARRNLLEAICADGDARWVEVVLELAFTSNDATIDAVARAVVHAPDARFILFFVNRLGSRVGRNSVRAALIAIGPEALEALAAALTSTGPERIRLHLPSAISMFGTPRAAEVLAHQLAKESSDVVRHRLLRELARMAARDEIIVDAMLLLTELRTHLIEYSRLVALEVAVVEATDERESALLLRSVVHGKISQALDRAFLALQALHPREDILEIQRVFDGDDARARAHGVEFLDTLTRTALYSQEDVRGIRDHLLVVGDDLDGRERLARIGLSATIPNRLIDAVLQLAREPDPLLAACADYYAKDLRGDRPDDVHPSAEFEKRVATPSYVDSSTCAD